MLYEYINYKCSKRSHTVQSLCMKTIVHRSPGFNRTLFTFSQPMASGWEHGGMESNFISSEDQMRLSLELETVTSGSSTAHLQYGCFLCVCILDLALNTRILTMDSVSICSILLPGKGILRYHIFPHTTKIVFVNILYMERLV